MDDNGSFLGKLVWGATSRGGGRKGRHLVKVDDESAINGEAEVPVGGGGNMNNIVKRKVLLICKDDVGSYKIFSLTVLL